MSPDEGMGGMMGRGGDEPPEDGGERGEIPARSLKPRRRGVVKREGRMIVSLLKNCPNH
ncbi:MAG: hypothetical protein IKR28_11320 [Selenomonadaceae bacterium]|nr:hypothetical protein [Selenomonadaceae bacterium]